MLYSFWFQFVTLLLYHYSLWAGPRFKCFCAIVSLTAGKYEARRKVFKGSSTVVSARPPPNISPSRLKSFRVRGNVRTAALMRATDKDVLRPNNQLPPEPILILISARLHDSAQRLKKFGEPSFF